MPVLQITKQAPVFWFVGLSGAGKTTLSRSVQTHLAAHGMSTLILDGDEVRSGLCSDLSFKREDRLENVRRIAEVAALASRQGITVLVATISPHAEMRDFCRERLPEMLQVFVDAPPEVCARRDPKGLYQRAHAGEIQGFTGVSAPFDRPKFSEVHVRTHEETIEACTLKILSVHPEWLMGLGAAVVASAASRSA